LESEPCICDSYICGEWERGTYQPCRESRMFGTGHPFICKVVVGWYALVPPHHTFISSPSRGRTHRHGYIPRMVPKAAGVLGDLTRNREPYFIFRALPHVTHRGIPISGMRLATADVPPTLVLSPEVDFTPDSQRRRWSYSCVD
jgi:hypothetical protein